MHFTFKAYKGKKKKITEKQESGWQLQGEVRQASSLTEAKNMQLAGDFDSEFLE